MRLLHTADWHVGKAIRGRSRLDELEGVLDEVLGIAESEGVDAVLLAGDVYDQLSASPDADRLVLSTLVRFHRVGIPVVMIPGNHDSAKRFAAFREVLDAVGTKAVPYVRPPTEGGIVQVGSRDGAETARVACVPFVAERRFCDAAALFDSTEGGYQSYGEGMGHVLSAMAGGVPRGHRQRRAGAPVHRRCAARRRRTRGHDRDGVRDLAEPSSGNGLLRRARPHAPPAGGEGCALAHEVCGLFAPARLR